MKKVFYTIIFFILFLFIQQIPSIFGSETVGFPFKTHKYWFAIVHNNLPNTATTHILYRPKNIYLNFAVYAMVVFLGYCYLRKQNPLKVLTNRITKIFKSKWFRRTILLLVCSFIIFAPLQFLPYHSGFEGNISRKIGFPQVFYYVVDAHCHRFIVFKSLGLVFNFIIIAFATLLLSFIVWLGKTLYHKIYAKRSQT